jgi:hypothetical protein
MLPRRSRPPDAAALGPPAPPPAKKQKPPGPVAELDMPSSPELVTNAGRNGAVADVAEVRLYGNIVRGLK